MTLDPGFLDALTEVIGIGIGKAATVLNTMLSSHISLTVPSIQLVPNQQLAGILRPGLPCRLSAVEMGYSGGLEGSIELIFTTEQAGLLVDCVTEGFEDTEEDFDSIRAGTLCEIGNIVINALLGTIANLARLELSYTVPAYLEGDVADLIGEARLEGSEMVLLVKTRFEVEALKVDGDIAVFFSLASYESLARALDRCCREA
jgi:chemotaxis protein CheC